MEMGKNVEYKRAQLKNNFLRIFDGPSADQTIFACPESLKPLRTVTRYYGGVPESILIEPEHGKKYNVLPGKYLDLTIPPKSASEDKICFSKPHREKFGQKFFQSPLISGIYERGYRQNFENFGFPGIEREFEEVQEFLLAAGATGVVLDLSCGSGFMTRKLTNSSR